MRSIRFQLLALLLSLTFCGWLLLALLTSFSERHEIRELLDAHLAQVARLIMVTVFHEAEEKDGLGFQKDLHRLHKYEYSIIFKVWSRNGTLLFQTPNAPAELLPTSPSGYSDFELQGEMWRQFSIEDPDAGHRLLVADRYGDRDILASKIIFNMLRPFLWVSPLLAVLIWFGVGRGLAPLRRLATDIPNRDYNCLSPVSMRDVPQEVAPLVRELNALFSRLDNAYMRFSRFTSDAAHELRTPLAGIRAQATVALRSPDKAGREHALRQVLKGSDRAAHLVEQMLLLARVDPNAIATSFKPIDLRQAASEVVDEMRSKATEQGLELQLEAPQSVSVPGDLELMKLLLGNLIGNAIAHTPSGGRIQVRLEQRQNRVDLSVEDTGPGVAAAELERIFDRFYRHPDNQREGFGLGLSISQRIAELHGAKIKASPGQQGLRIQITFLDSDS